ncbi:MAG: type III-A CRISPR-associated protein Csm2 [Chloroflexota bacterium]
MSYSQRSPAAVLAQPGEIRRIIRDGDPETLVDCAERIGKSLNDVRLTTAQIRGIFGRVRQIEMSWRIGEPSDDAQSWYQVKMLQPKLAYQAGRGQPGVKQLEAVIKPAILEIEGKRDRFQHFVDFFEAILAYHKAAGGK